MFERFVEAITTAEPKKHGRVTAVANATGYSKAMISAVLTGREPLHEKLLNAICSAYNINKEWVKTGNGKMLNSLHINHEGIKSLNHKALDVLLKAKKFRDEIDSMIKNYECNLEEDLEWLEHSSPELDEWEDDDGASLYEMVIDSPVRVRKGELKTLPVLHYTVENNETPAWNGVEKISSPFLMDPDSCFAVRIEGDSMSPKYEHGDVVIADSSTHPDSGMPVVAKLVNGRLLVKRIRYVGDLVFLESINQNSKYEPVVINKDQLESAYRIVWVYSPEFMN
jgi:transcriptional regulator with XRE-family HTH domain